ncbi:MAG: PA14 domain-containing protein [Polyangiales bacterium]
MSVLRGSSVIWRGQFTVVKSDAGLIAPTPVARGLVGTVYRIARNTQRLPNFVRMKPIATIALPNLSVAPRRWTSGFPGVTDDGKPIQEWFAIRFVSKLVVPKDAKVQFKLISDDGATLHINGGTIVNNDGIHKPRAKTGTVRLKKGVHNLVVGYFQGPKWEIALQLYWRFSDNEEWKLVPTESLLR